MDSKKVIEYWLRTAEDDRKVAAHSMNGENAVDCQKELQTVFEKGAWLQSNLK